MWREREREREGGGETYPLCSQLPLVYTFQSTIASSQGYAFPPNLQLHHTVAALIKVNERRVKEDKKRREE